jgi:FkbM family methyltransferase
MRKPISRTAVAVLLLTCGLWSLWSTISTLLSLPKEAAVLSSPSPPRYESSTHHQQDDLITTSIQRLVQIGANDGSNRGNDHTIRKLLADSNTHALLVEPNPQVFDMLKSTIATDYKNTARIKPINALVCPKGANLTFFVVDEKLVEDYPDAPHWVRYQLSSLKLLNINTGLQYYLDSKRKRKRKGPSAAAAYIKNVTIPCTPFVSVLEQGGFAPQDVNVLAVDTEGHDAKVVTDALQVPGFLPRTIIFEVKGLPVDERDTLLDMLEERGYTTDCPKVGGVRVQCSGADVKAQIIGQIPSVA